MMYKKLIIMVMSGLLTGQVAAMKRPATLEYNQGAVKRPNQNTGSITFRVTTKTDLAVGKKQTKWDTVLQGRPLHNILKDGNAVEFWMAVQSGAQLDEKDRDGVPILHNVYFKNKCRDKRSWLDILVNAGADVQGTSKNDMTLLHRMVCHGVSSHDVTYLLKKGANVDAVDAERWTPLHHAAAAGFIWDENTVSLLKLLIDNKTDPNRQNIDGNTSLHLAASNKKISQFLLCAGANAEIKNNNGQTPYDCSAHDGKPNKDLIDAPATSEIIKPHLLKTMGNPFFFLGARSMGSKKRVGFKELTDSYIASNQEYDTDSVFSTEEHIGGDSDSMASIEEDTD